MFLQNVIVFVLIGLSMLSGGIPNVIYASDNGILQSDMCFLSSIDADPEFCSDLERVVATEASSGVSQHSLCSPY